jgi:hypothetical protein
MADETDFSGQSLAWRLERHMTYEEVVDYFVEVEGKEQVISITLGPAAVGVFPDPGAPPEPFLSALGIVNRTEGERGPTGAHAGRPRVAITIGPSCRNGLPSKTNTFAWPRRTCAMFNCGPPRVFT